MGHAPDTFGVRLIKAQARARIGNRELARKVGMGNSTISIFRIDRAHPSFQALSRICEVLNCSADYLLGFTEDMATRKRHEADI